VFVRDTDNARHYKKTKVAPFETILETHYKPITIAQLNSLIREYFHPQNMVVALMSSKKVSLAKLKTLCEKMAE
jgi:RNase H-fold protein (predicted Holliday junction resolvase)